MLTAYELTAEEAKERAIRSREYVRKMRDVVSDEALLALGMRRSTDRRHVVTQDQVNVQLAEIESEDKAAKRREYMRAYMAAKRKPLS